MTPLRTRGVRGFVMSVALMSMLAGCSLGSGDDAAGSAARPSASAATPPPSASAPRPDPAGLSGYYRQRLVWTSCRGQDRCARLRVPLDYDRPTGRSISIALLKVPASGHRLGSMVVDPGGPGASGVDYAAGGEGTFGAALTSVYDVVGLDPRGVGSSTPLRCVSGRQLSALIDSDQDPATTAARASYDAKLRGLGEGCLRHDAGLTRHVSTEEVARDVDVLRAALGDRTLTYFGASYGTAIGAEYAQLFPRRVGRMVLDGALDPATSTVETSLVQAHGFEVALRSYVRACVDRGRCFLGSSVDQGVRRIQTLLDGLDRKPLPASGRTLTQSDGLYGVWAPLYDKRLWTILDQALKNAMSGDGSLLLRVADAYVQRTPGPGGNDVYASNLFQAITAINCLDKDDGVPSAQVGRYRARFAKASPTFGAAFAYSTATCAVWPVHSHRKPAPVTAEGSPPILVMGTTRDPATPLVWARSLARQLEHGVLVVRDGDGHTAFRQGSACVDRTVERYFVSGDVPQGEVSCS